MKRFQTLKIRKRATRCKYCSLGQEKQLQKSHTMQRLITDVWYHIRLEEGGFQDKSGLKVWRSRSSEKNVCPLLRTQRIPPAPGAGQTVQAKYLELNSFLLRRIFRPTDGVCPASPRTCLHLEAVAFHFQHNVPGDDRVPAFYQLEVCLRK